MNFLFKKKNVTIVLALSAVCGQYRVLTTYCVGVGSTVCGTALKKKINIEKIGHETSLISVWTLTLAVNEDIETISAFS